MGEEEEEKEEEHVPRLQACKKTRELLKTHPEATPNEVRKHLSEEFHFDESRIEKFLQKCRLKLVQKIDFDPSKKCGDRCTMKFCTLVDGVKGNDCTEETGYILRNTKKCGMHKPKSCLPLSEKCKSVLCAEPNCKAGEKLIDAKPERGKCCARCKKIGEGEGDYGQEDDEYKEQEEEEEKEEEEIEEEEEEEEEKEEEEEEDESDFD